jgi:signal transduction histidine kinase/DNA-binding response OmpR family regulator/streptogramin lyase
VTGFVAYEGGVLMVGIHGILYYRDGKLFDDYIDFGELPGNDILFRTAMLDRHGNLFVGTMGNGLCWVPKGEHKLQPYEYQSASFDLSTSTVWALFEDNQDNLWVGCQKRGLLMLPQRKPQFRSWKLADQHVNTGGSLTSICMGDDGVTWCAVQNNGIFGLDTDGRLIAHPASPQGTYLLYRDKRGDYWVGTNSGLFAYNPMTGASSQKVSFKNGFVNAMTDDGIGNIYFSVYSEGLWVYNTATGAVRKFSMHDENTERGSIHNDWVTRLMFDSNGKLWVCSSSGVNCYDPQNDHFHPYGWEVILDYNSIETICETSDHQILFGTNYGLYIYDKKKGEAVPMPGAEILNNRLVGGIVEDASGDIWCSTTMGIWQYQKQKKHFVGYVYGNGLVTREYAPGVVMRTSDDRIWFGVSDGITSFLPDDLRKSNYNPGDIHLTGLFIGSNSVNCSTLSDDRPVITQPLDASNRLEFSYLDNTFTMEFSLLNFSNAENVFYEYRINGAKEWTRTLAGRNRIPFTHMQPGSYILEVRAFDSGAYTETKVYHIVVRAPWYRSAWAYLIYILGVLGILGILVWSYIHRRKQELDEEKMKFLINATHDIRSPLTLIMSPLHKLLRRELDPEVKTELKTIEHNAQRVQNLVNQILDIRKIDKQQMKLQCQETDMVQYVGNILKSYEYTAKERGMTFRYVPAVDKLKVWLDRNALDKVVDNLLSNAFKYTYDGGEIEVRVEEGDQQNAILQVIDNGMGIRGDVHKIFDRFYQSSATRSLHIEGTGIGLNLCKMMVEMHHGTIEAANREDSQGSIFTVSLPLGTSHLTKEEMLVAEEREKVTKPKSMSSYKVLVVDDDVEIGEYISQELGTYYRITAVTNAREALRLLLGTEPEKQFDLVVSDVMMPEMDGFTMLRMIKTNMNISHIPVVMLTSKSDVANRLEGLEKGADAFLAKPFDMDELHVTINNLISKNLRLKGKYSGTQQQKDKVVETNVKGNDEALMERIMKVVNEHMSDSDFNVEQLTKEVGISRAQLHRKMKEMTGLPVSEFIRNIRLEQAVRLLKEQKINVTQVAYSVGFSNLAHFSTVFRKQFGVSPTEYIEQKT